MSLDVIKFDEMKKTWHQIARHQDSEPDTQFQLAVHKKLLEIFQVGESYYYIVNLAQVKMEYVSDKVIPIIGVRSREAFTVEYIFENVHPDDKERFIAHEKTVTTFFNQLPPEKVLKYKVTYDYRLRRTDGQYIWILMQTVTIQTNESGAVIRVLGVQSDITHLKTGDIPAGLSFIGLDGEPSYYNVAVASGRQQASNELFTKREKEVLGLIVNAKSTKNIAETLFISIHTVNTHRKNILAKSGCYNTVDLVAKALQEGWV